MDERELIARLQKRDEAAFEELIRQYEKKVYSLCFRMCGNSEDAEEAAQDAFLALWRGIDRFRQESSLSTWIYRLATNACIDTLRRRKKQSGSVSLDDEELFVDAGRHLAPAAGDGRAPRGTEIIAGGPLRLAGGVPKGAHPARDRRPELHRDRRKRVDRAGHGQIAHQQGPITFAQLFIRKRELF